MWWSKPTIKKPKTAAQLIDVIDDFLTEAYQDEGEYEFWKAWNLLTALRGPDSGDETVKFNTTAILRGLIFPKLTKKMMGSVLAPLVVREKSSLSEVRFSGDEEPHFRMHIRYAMECLRRLGVK